MCQHLSGNLKASQVHTFLYTFLYAFLISVIHKGSFYAYRIPEFVIGTEFGICETGNLQLLYGFPYLRVIEQVGRNLLRVGIDFREETEPQDHHALVGDGMRSELREFYEGEMQALDNLIAVLIMHDAVVVDKIRSIMRKDIIYQVERIHGLQFAVFTALFSLTHIEFGCIEQYSLLECVRPFHLHFHAELPASDVGAEYIHYGVLAPFELGHKFCRQILDFVYLLLFANLKVSSKSFKGEGEVALAMGGNTPGNYEYTLEGSVSDAKVLTLKANVPVPMGGIDINFIQGETPIAYYVASTYQYDTNLAISVRGTSYGSTEDCKAIVKRASETTVDITLNGFGNLSGGGNMNLGDFTISGVKVEKANSGYTLSLGAFESTAESASGTPTAITGESLEGTVTTDGKAEITVAFKPGSMPMAITAVFTGNVNETSAQ